ncbi:acyl-CoA thioesterase [Rhodocyclus tenuis]|uniref:Acyl-CoA hydrolase n=1 Tax=Rhodocyclus tenuis TaxID=1066 RepID=A0A840GAK6_RHOTE|nr:hotdog domain-containing protein [Rhodocyclus tenuis]MBB4247698.1 acyl-CoA hydrolase [Rhodocyclus tenuis]
MLAAPSPGLRASAPTPGLFRLVDVVFPGQANHHGSLFGGAALAMMDKFAFVLASRHLRRTVVTAALTDTDFRAPVPVGHLAEVDGRIVHCGRRSVVIEAELVAENMLSGQRQSCLSGRFVMVGQEHEAAAPTLLPSLADEDELVRVVEIVFPGQTSHHGFLHGGFALDWLAKAALVAASRRARQSVLMVSSKTLDFVAPARVGDIVETTARVVAVGRSSLTVATEMTAECPLAGEPRRCTQADFVFVAVDGDGRPVPLASTPLSSVTPSL